MIATPLRASGLKVYDANGDLVATCVSAQLAIALVALANASAYR